jgi:hypothetical protein
LVEAKEEPRESIERDWYDMISGHQITELANFDAKSFSEKQGNRKNGHSPTLDEIQIRAYRVRRRHGGLGGGYTLDDWLEAEHELEDEVQNNRRKRNNKLQ